MTPLPALVPGTRVGPYEIRNAIGAGGMGEVYRARDPRLAPLRDSPEYAAAPAASVTAAPAR